jgi:hypothetical protein
MNLNNVMGGGNHELWLINCPSSFQGVLYAKSFV